MIRLCMELWWVSEGRNCICNCGGGLRLKLIKSLEEGGSRMCVRLFVLREVSSRPALSVES